MTEKKFKLIKSDPAEPYDSRMYIGIKYDSKELYGYSEICDLLNEQNEAIIKLKIENQILQGENEDLNEDLLQLESFRNLLKSKGIDLDD